MTLIYVLIAIMFAHFIADFQFQSRWMAENKSSNWLALCIHIGAYMGILFLYFFWMSVVIGHGSITKMIQYVVLNGILHFATDAITSRLTTRFYKAQNMHAFWVTIGFDQFVHFTCLALTLPIIL